MTKAGQRDELSYMNCQEIYTQKHTNDKLWFEEGTDL